MALYEVLLFDLDGTLTDSKEGITKSVQYALSKFGIEENELKELEKFIGPPLDESFNKFYSLKDEKVDRAIKYYREYYSVKGIYENSLYLGVPELLTQLRKLDKNMYVATTKPTVFAKEVLKHFNLDSYFIKIVGSFLDGSRTSKKELIEHVLSHIPKVAKSKIVMIGDRMHDILGANQVGIDSIAVSYGYGSEVELMKAKPTYLVKSIKELQNIFC
ncbi:MAG TPA: HAD hydrolase-like protein [Thermoanaerobacterales bacterium]|nr:HAD hydrolase-like protein [Thermoanaerobacterales bacterium]